MGSGKFGFYGKKDKASVEKVKVEFSVKEACHKIQRKLKKTEKKKTEVDTRQKQIWWNECGSREYTQSIY